MDVEGRINEYRAKSMAVEGRINRCREQTQWMLREESIDAGRKINEP
jgi:hypothetical protein